MNRSEIAKAIMEETGITPRQAHDVVEIITKSVTKALKRGDGVYIRDFGTFSAHKRKSRTGRNPKTGIAIRVASKRVVRFKPSKSLLALLLGEPTDDVGPRAFEPNDDTGPWGKR